MITLRTSLTGVFLVSADCLLGALSKLSPHPTDPTGRAFPECHSAHPVAQSRRYEWVSKIFPGAGGVAETQEEATIYAEMREGSDGCGSTTR